jgi:hypothetical protein
MFLGWKLYKYFPHSKRKESSRFLNGICDLYPGAGNGNLIFEVNMPLWRFGREKSRSMSVQQTEQMRSARVTAARQQAALTKRRRNIITHCYTLLHVFKV